MGFVSFNENYYSRKLKTLENKKLNAEDLYEIRQLLKVLDDLTDEGYTNLNLCMEADFSCLTRLRALLEKEGALPFPMVSKSMESITYSNEERELSCYLEEVMQEAKDVSSSPSNPFLHDIQKYCQWIPYDADTAYVFLLRDTLLPYVYFKDRYKSHVYPWLISRKFLEDVAKKEFIDDEIRLPIYEALEEGHVDYPDCCSYCKEKILHVLGQHEELKQILLDLLGSLKEKRIVVVESGYMGTIPMMLKALDDRVTIRLYTTAPFLYETYKNQIFCRKYEDVRRFETLHCQNFLMRYSSFHDGKFHVNVIEDEKIRNLSLREISDFLKERKH